MAYIRRQKSNGYVYLQRVEKYWDKEAKKYRLRILQNLGKEHTVVSPAESAIIWSAAHTLGHIAIEEGNELLAAVPEGEGETTELPCHLIEAGKFRNGRPRWWCRTHQIHFGKKTDVSCCSNAEIAMNYCRNPMDLKFEEYPGGVAIWAALPPAICTRTEGPSEPTGIHIHARKKSGGVKYIDQTFPALTVTFNESLGISTIKMHITPPAAVAWLDSTERGVPMEVCRCSHCSTPHLDLGYFAQNPHKMHLCGHCGREFRVRKPSISNPLALLSEALEKRARQQIPAPHTLDIQSQDYPGGIEIWPSTPAILWTSDRPEQVGIHVHAFDAEGRRRVDETFAEVTLDGQKLNRWELLKPLLYTYHRPKPTNPYQAHPDDKLN